MQRDSQNYDSPEEMTDEELKKALAVASGLGPEARYRELSNEAALRWMEIEW